MLRALLCDVIRQAKDRRGYSYLRPQTMLSGNRKAGSPAIRTLARLVRTPAASLEKGVVCGLPPRVVMFVSTRYAKTLNSKGPDRNV